MSILIKGMEMPESCDGCKLKSCGYCDITNRLIPYDGSRHGDCPLVEVPDEQPDRNAQERYEDLCEYFKDCSDKGIGILRDRKEFKAWLERLHWHVVRCDELGRELEKLQSAQPEPLSDAYMKAVWTWLLNYQIKASELKGRYTPYEVLSWVANDWRKEHE